MTISADQAVIARDTHLAERSREFLPGDRERAELLADPAAALIEEVKPSDRHYKQRFCLVAAFVGLVGMLFLVWMVVSGASRMRDIVDNVVQLLAGLVAVAMCAGAARRNRQRYTGWALLTASLFVTQCGNAIWFYYDVLRGEPVSASLGAEVCIGSALPLAVAAMLTFPNALGTAASHLRGLLDAVLIGTGMFFIGWTLVLSQVYDNQSGGVVAEIFNLAYPSAGILIASLVTILATRPGSGYRIRLGLVSAGLLSCAVADCSFSYLTAVHRYGTGNPIDAGWVLGYLLIALGALWAWNHPVARYDTTDRPTVLTLIGPNLPLVGVALAAVWQIYVHHSLDEVSEFSFGAVVLTMSARQLLVLLDHLALGRQLESKVEQRTVELHHQAFHDGLTGLANRALFNKYLDDAVQEREGTCAGLAVLLIDLHNFKRVNDLYGHPAGDELLRLVATRLQTILQGADTLARVGGDEFGVLLHGPGARIDVEHVARLVIAALGQPFAIASTSLVVEAAIGLAAGGPEETSGDDLLRDAGLALSVAKTKGGHCCEVYSPLLHSSILEALRTEADMRCALERDEFVVYYQPVVDLSTVAIQGVEALVRWNHPQRGFLGPDKFIAVAEATGIIGAVGAWVLRRACLDIAGIATNGAGPPLWLSVNLSALQLEDDNLVATVSEALEESGLDASRLTLEVTETVIMNDVPRSIHALTALRKVGVKIAIDDFGTGYSSLGALRYLPVDTLKIDRSFVTDLARDRPSSDLTRRTLQLAADFHLRTVAEGVEEVVQLEILRGFGCDSVQGFLFAKPQPLADIVKLLATGLRLPAPPAALGATDEPASGRSSRESELCVGNRVRRPEPTSNGKPASAAVL
jgi:diguanylate cyclase (GGDEF)-like protein